MPSNWFRTMREQHIDFPSSYMTWDTETTGRVAGQDLILQIGHCIVDNGVIVDRNSFILNWLLLPNVCNKKWLNTRLEYLKNLFASKGKPYHLSIDKIISEGVNPIGVLGAYYDMFNHRQDSGGWFVTHNGWHFDNPMIEAHFSEFTPSPFIFRDSACIDTGMFAKASQLNLLPKKKEVLKDYYKRVHSAYGRGIKWSLDEHCTKVYGLTERYDLDMSGAHDAEFDAYVTHLLLEEFKHLSGETRAKRK